MVYFVVDSYVKYKMYNKTIPIIYFCSYLIFIETNFIYLKWKYDFNQSLGSYNGNDNKQCRT